MIRIKRLFKSFIYAYRGLSKTIREEQNLKIQIVTAFLVLILGVYLGLKRIEWCFIFFAIGLVISMEVVNSAIERITDILKPRIHEYVKEIKDIMAAGVLLASLLAVAIGILVFWPYIMAYLGIWQ